MFCQALNAAVRPSIARCRVSGETPPTQVGLPLLQLLITPWSLIFHGIGIASGFQVTSEILVPLLVTASMLPPARAREMPAAMIADSNRSAVIRRRSRRAAAAARQRKRGHLIEFAR